MGADIGMHVGKNFIVEFSERSYRAYIIKLLNDHKMLGEKSGKGFYTFGKKCALCASSTKPRCCAVEAGTMLASASIQCTYCPLKVYRCGAVGGKRCRTRR